MTEALELLFQGKMPVFMADENGWEKTHAGMGTRAGTISSVATAE